MRVLAAADLQGNSEGKLYVVGHTDTVGKLKYNMQFSKLRAEAVVKALSSDHGSSLERLLAEGVGPPCTCRLEFHGGRPAQEPSC